MPPKKLLELEDLIRDLLSGIGEDPKREGLRETPRRMAEMLEELTQGYRISPEDVIAGAIFPVDYDDMVVLKDISFYSLCVHGKSMIYTPQGAMCAKDVRPGQQLFTLDPATKELGFTEVLAVSRTKHRERYHLFFEGGHLRATGEHPVYILDKGFVPLREVRPGDHLLGVHSRKLRRPRYPVSLGYSLGYVLGALASDGSVDSGRRLRLEVNEKAFASKLATQLKHAFGVRAEVESIRKPSGFLRREIQQYRVRICSSFLTDLITCLLGGELRSKSFRFPEVVRHSHETMRGFLEGYIDGDGHRIKKTPHAHMIVSANLPFLERLGELLDTRVGQQKPGIGTLYISPRWFEARRTSKGFKHGFRPESQMHLLKKALEKVQTRIYRVKAVQRERATLKSFTMYNFECSPHNSYLVNGILAHNCEHHIIPFFGKIHVGYIPKGKVIGTSKIPRIIEVFSKRLQLQERMTEEIASFLEKAIEPLGVGVVAEGFHLCMAMRGVRKEEARLITSAMKGSFRRDARTRAEFLHLIGRTELLGR